MSDSELQATWIKVQAVREDALQLNLICSDLFPLFRELCSDTNSRCYRQTFGDGTVLVSVLCRIFVRESRSAVSQGAEGVSSLLCSVNHVTLLSFIATVLDPSFYATTTERLALDPIVRIVALHNVVSIIISLHNSFLGVLSSTSGIVSAEAVVAEQKHLCVLQLLLLFRDSSLLSEFGQCNGLMAVVSTLSVCYGITFQCSASLTSLACELLTSLLSDSAILETISNASSWTTADQLIREAIADDARSQEDIALPLQFQKLQTLSHCLNFCVLIREQTKISSEHLFGPLSTAMLSLQRPMKEQKRLTESICDAYLRLAFSESDQIKGDTKKKKKSFFSAALSTAKGILSNQKEEPHVEKRTLLTNASCFLSAASFIANACIPEPRIIMLSRLVRVLQGGDVDGAVAATVVEALVHKLTNYDEATLIELLESISQLTSCLQDISSTLSKLSSNIIGIESQQRLLVLTFFSTAAHTSQEMADAIAECGVIEASCTVLKCFNDSPSGINQQSVGMSEAIFCLWKVLYDRHHFRFSVAVPIVFKSTLLDPINENVVAFGGASRNAIVPLIARRTSDVSVVLECLLRTDGAAPWQTTHSRAMITLAMITFGSSCQEEIIKRNGLEIILALLQAVRHSDSFLFDLHTIGVVLMILLQWVRWSGACRMLAAALPVDFHNEPYSVNVLLMIGAGFGIQRSLIAQLLDFVGTNGAGLSEGAAELVKGQGETALCDHLDIISILVQWHSEAPTALVSEAICFLVSAYRAPLTDADICKTIVANEWNDLMPLVAEYSSCVPTITDSTTTEKGMTLWKSLAQSDWTRNTLTLCGRAGVDSKIQLSANNWPPTAGFTVAGWYYWQQCRDASSTLITLWELRWCPSGAREVAVTLQMDTGLQVVTLRIDGPTVVSHTLLEVPSHSWTHVALTFTRGGDLSYFLNGCLVQKVTAPYPAIAGLREGTFATTNTFRYIVGNPTGCDGDTLSLGIGPMQVFEGALSEDSVRSIAVATHIRDASQLGAAGDHQMSIHSPVIGGFFLSAIGCSDIGAVTRKELVQWRPPEHAAVLSVNPSVAALIDAPLRYLDNKEWVLLNMASSIGDLYIHGRHTAPPVEAPLPTPYLVAHCGTVWLGWLRACCEVPRTRSLLTILDIIGEVSSEGLDMTELSSRSHYHEIATLIMTYPKVFAETVVVEKIVRMALRPVCFVSRAAGQRSMCWASIVVNGVIAETLLLNWHFLSNIHPDATAVVLRALTQLLDASNPFGELNARRLHTFGFIDGFVLGLVRYYAGLAHMHEIMLIIELFASRLSWDGAVMSELLTVATATIPLNSDEGSHLQKLSSPLSPLLMPYISLARNVVLRAMVKVAPQNDYLLGNIIPPAWFIAVTDKASHPVSASLAVALFCSLYLGSSNFRTRSERSNVLRGLARTLQHHSYQIDILTSIGLLAGGSVQNVFSLPSEDITSKANQIFPAVVALYMHLIKHCALSAQQLTTRYVGVPVASYFSSVQLYHRPSRFRVVSKLILALRLLQRSREGSGEQRMRQEVSATERSSRCQLVVASFRMLSQLISRYEAITAQLYNTMQTYTPLENVCWVLLSSFAGTIATDSFSPHADPVPLTHNDSDSDCELISVPSVEVSDLEQPQMTEVFDAAISFYLKLLETFVLQFEPATVGWLNYKTSDFVLMFHNIISSCPRNVGDKNFTAFSVHLITNWLSSLLKILRRSPLVGETGHNVTRNAFYLAQYLVDRLLSGYAVPPRALGSFLASLIAITSNHELVKALKLSLVDWALFVASSENHSWSPQRMAQSRDILFDFKQLLFSSSFPNSDVTKLFTTRLLEISLAVVPNIASTRDPGATRLADVWHALFSANRSSSVFSLLLVDGGGTTGRQRIDLLHGGFDLLHHHGNHSMFLQWFVENRFHVSEVLNNNPHVRSETKFVTANPKRYQRLTNKSLLDMAAEKRSHEQRVDESFRVLQTFWEQFAFAGSFVDPGLLEMKDRTFPRKPLIVGSGRQKDLCMLPSGHLCKVNVSAVVDNGSVPLSVYMSHAGTGCVPIVPAEVDILPGKISSQLIIDKLLMGDFCDVRDAPALWVGNVYYQCGNESLVSMMIITRLEVVVVSCAQVTSDGNVFIASLETHDAANRAQRRTATVKNMIRKLLPKTPIHAALSTETLAAFRHSQYYRQLRTEARTIQGSSRVWRFPLSALSEIHHRYFQHQPAALEFVLEDSSRHFAVFLDADLVMSRDVRSTVGNILTDAAPHILVETSTAKRNRMTTLQKKWLRRQTSTLDYLMAVNDAASRTVADLTQYPVFPWVLSVYDEVHIDIDNAVYYRDMSKPVGALSTQRRQDVQARFSEWLDETTPPFHFGTHYSTSAVVMFFLVRLQPFTQLSINYQGGRLDVADRLFHSVEEAWASCSSASGRDVKELIPEFFTQAGFVANSNNVALGTRRDGVTLSDVVLPPWAAGSASRFVRINRAALESDVVSSTIHSWIDLIFGFRQRGPDAIEACNIFHHLSYAEGLETAMTDAASEEDRKAIVASVDNFGLTPKQVFKAAHPKRLPTQSASRQQIFIAAAPLLQKKAVSVTHCDAQCVGQPITRIWDMEGTVMVSTSHHWTSRVRPFQYFVSDPARSLVINVRHRDHGMSLLPDVGTFGLGVTTAFEVSASGNIVLLGTSRGKVVVMGRPSSSSRYTIEHIIHLTSQSRVRFLRFLSPDQVCVIVEGDTMVTMVTLSRLAVDVSSFSVRFAFDASLPKVAAVYDDTSSTLIVAKERSICIISDGALLGYGLLDEAPFDLAAVTAIGVMRFGGFSLLGVVVTGHSDGNVCIWAVSCDPARADRSFSITAVSSTQMDRSAITAILTQANTMSVLVGSESGSVSSLFAPQQSDLAADL